MNDELNVIKFWPWDEELEHLTLPPIPAVKGISEQWRSFPRWVENEEGHKTVKHCMPFFDAMTAGYLYLLAEDVEFTFVNGQPTIKCAHPAPLVEIRSIKEIPAPDGYYPIQFSWQMWWGMKLPDGWSALITHPSNHHDLPFRVVSGIADYDVYNQPGNIGFFILNGWTGVLPKGTPMFQIIPIKRGDWVMEIDRSLSEKGRAYNDHKLEVTKTSGWDDYYKKKIRIDKKYF